jgi:uncharacterized protein (TIGR02145 family)
LSAASGGAEIDWYDAATGGTALLSGNNTYTTPSISTSTTYYAQARIAATGCVSAARTPVVATVNPVPANPTVTAGSRCGAGTVTLSAASGGAEIDWYDAATGGTPLLSGNNTYTTSSLTASTTYYAQARIAATGCVSAARVAVTATVNTVPAVPATPTQDGPKCAGTAITFSTAAVAGATGLDWDGTNISGSGTSKTTATAAGTYQARVRSYLTSGGATCYSAYSTYTAGVIYAMPVITSHPASTSTVTGSQVTLSVVASNVTAYQWKKDGANVVDGSGGTTANYTTAALMANATYTVVVSNGQSACSTTSNAALITVVMPNCTPAGSTVNFTVFVPCPNAVVGTVWYLIDTRETNNQQTYKVKKMADEHIWMVQDLKFGNLCGTDLLFESGADQTGLVSNTGSYFGDCSAATITSTPSARGYFYNWPAAINKREAYYGSANDVGCSGTASGTSGRAPGACRGICPAGWHIPTGDTDGEFYTLHIKTGGCSTSNDSCWNNTSAWEGVYGGELFPNYPPDFQGDRGYYWSSTFRNYVNAYGLSFGYYPIEPGTNINLSKKYGRTVRCLMNY